MVNQLGVKGEDIAVSYLLEQGWTIRERNWRCRYGEIDVIAVDSTGALVFVEVKTRAGTGFGAPLEAITREKLSRLRQLAAQWLHEHPQHRTGVVRVDAIGIVRRRGWAPEITHVRGVA